MNDDARKRTQPPVTPLSETGIEARSGTRPNVARPPADSQTRGPSASGSASSSTPYVIQSGTPTVNAVVAGYEILNELGRGAMGVVYKARHLKLNRIVALKMTLGGRIDPKDLIRFLAEAEAVASVKHDNVVQVYDYGESGGRPYMALEFCPAGALSEVLRDEGRLHPTDAAEMVAKIAEGVAAAHDQGIVHRDLKPANILLQVEARRAGEALGEDDIATLPLEDLTPKVSDFGLAKRAASDLTATQAVMGTPAYMSPEQAVGKTKYVGPAADVWALGVILYECLTGSKPFHGGNTYEVMAQILSEEPTAVRTVNAKVPYDLELIVRKCMEKAAADRYPTARELADDLDRFVRGEPISVRPLSAATRAKRWVKRNKAVTALLVLVALVTLGLMGSLYQQSAHAKQQAESNDKARVAAEEAKINAEKAAQEAKKLEVAKRQIAEAQVATVSAKAQAEQVDIFVNLLNDLFRSSDPLAQFFGDAAPALGVSGPAENKIAVLGPFLRTAAERFKGSLNDPAAALTRAKLLAGIGNGMKALGLYAEARPLLEEALKIRREKLPETSPEVWQSELDMGRLEGEGGDLLASIDRFRKVQALQKKAKADPAAILNARFLEAMALSVTGMPEAGPVIKDVLAERTALLGRGHSDTVLTKIGLISWLLEHGESAEVLTLFRELKEDIKKLPDAHVREIFEPVLDGQVKIATAFGARKFPVLLKSTVEGMKGDIAKLEKLIPNDHLVLLVFRFVLAQLSGELGNRAEADALFERVRSDTRKTVGLAHPRALMFLGTYSRWLVDTDRAQEARELFDEMEAANRARFGPENPWRTVILLKRARFEHKQGDPDAAREKVKAAVALVRLGKFLPTAEALNELFETARALGRSDRAPELRAAARDMFTALRPLIVKVYGQQSNEMMILLSAEGEQLYEVGSRRAAAERLDEGLRVAATLRRLNLDEWANLYFYSGRVEMDRGQFRAAEQHFRDAIRESKRLSDPSADRREYTEYLGRAIAAQGRYADAVTQFEEARRSTGPKAPEDTQIWGDFQVATAQLASGDRAGYDKTRAKLAARCEKVTDANGLSRLAWAGGLAPNPGAWDVAAFEQRYAEALKPDTKYPWGWRGLALVRLRAGKLDAAGAALEKAGAPAAPVDHLIRGLLAVARDDKAAAKAALAKAEALIEDQSPSDKDPFAYAGRLWHMQVEEAVLLTELRTAVGAPKE